jgi:hypothetical protein
VVVVVVVAVAAAAAVAVDKIGVNHIIIHHFIDISLLFLSI